MKIYFAGSIRGATFEGKEEVYKAIVAAIREKHTLLSEHAASTGTPDNLTDEQIHARDLAWIDDCDFMIAEVSAPSLGVGYEIAYALYMYDITILCLHKSDVRVSAMLTGNTNLLIEKYDTPEQAAAIVGAFLNGQYFG